MNKILIIDDEEKLGQLLARIIGLEGFETMVAKDGKTGLKLLDQQPFDLVLCDVKLPDFNGVDLCKRIKDKFPIIEVILLTAYGTIPDGVQGMKNGAFDYLTKGDENNKIIPLVHRAIEKVELAKRVNHLEKRLENRSSFAAIIGDSLAIRQAIALAKKVAVSDTTVLLTGETGTGKEVFANAIHNESPRQKEHFVAVNCSAFSKELLESELFGHKAGSFTGAIRDKQGLFEEANRGTLFLDEIGEMPLDLQAKLLRVLETGEFHKVGESKTSKTNVRIIAATNRNLKNEVEKDHFREDLFYRISTFQIQLPPLRERLDDLDLFCKYFLSYFCHKTKKRIGGYSAEFIGALKSHAWNGNIRELKNVIERAVILCEEEQLQKEHLPLEFQALSSKNAKQLSAFDLASAEKIHIQKVLNYTNGNKTKTADLLGIALTTLYRKLDEFGMNGLK